MAGFAIVICIGIEADRASGGIAVAKPEIQFVGPVVDRRPKKPRNGYGRWGLFLPFVSCGLLAPLGLLLSFRGLFSRPRTSAVFGTLINGAICMFGFLPAAVHIADDMDRHHRRSEQRRHEQAQVDRAAVSQTIAEAQKKISEFVAANGGLPDGVAGNKLIVGFSDRWEQPLRYEVPLAMDATNYAIRSAGRDQKFETRDDIKVEYSSTSRNETSTPTAAPADSLNLPAEAPIGEALRQIEVLDKQGRKFIVVINR
jgi:hypothetical protein